MPLLNLNELGEKSHATIVKFVNKAKSNFYRKMFFIGQNLKHVQMTYSFLELLIFFRLSLVNIHTSKKYCKQIQTPKETSHETDTNRYIFSFVSDIDVEKACFFI